MNLVSSKITWPPAPPPPWVNQPLHVAAEGKSTNAIATVLVALFLVLLVLSILIFWRKSWKSRIGQAERRRDLEIRRRLIPVIGEDAQWLSAREMQSRLIQLTIDPSQCKVEIQQLELLEKSRFSKTA